jgi:hypothetical protein
VSPADAAIIEPWTTHDSAKCRACYEGAFGARGMHALQNYGHRAKTYDQKVYTYTATYNADAKLLHIYGHHVAVLTPGGPDTYHMTEIGAYHMASLDAFRHGVAAFRPFRELAAQNRQEFIPSR